MFSIRNTAGFCLLQGHSILACTISAWNSLQACSLHIEHGYMCVYLSCALMWSYCCKSPCSRYKCSMHTFHDQTLKREKSPAKGFQWLLICGKLVCMCGTIEYDDTAVLRALGSWMWGLIHRSFSDGAEGVPLHTWMQLSACLHLYLSFIPFFFNSLFLILILPLFLMCYYAVFSCKSSHLTSTFSVFSRDSQKMYL